MKAWYKLAAPLLAACAVQAFAQTYPAKAVHTVITFPPGSGTDLVGRIVGTKLSEYWGQPVVAENRSGAGGSVGSAMVAKAAPDGYTLLINSSGHAVNPAIFANLPYDTSKDFTNIAPLTMLPNVLVVSSSSPHKTVMDLVSFAKSNPGAVNFAHGGVGGATHLNLEKFIDAANIKVTQVPYKGSPEVIVGIISGEVDCFWTPLSSALSHIKSGKLRALVVSSAKRSAMLPDVPTTSEAGVRNAEAPIWFGLWGPAGMPTDVVSKINADVRRALNDPAVRAKLASLGNDPMDMSPDEFTRFVRGEIDEYERVVRAAGVKKQ